MLDSRPGKAEVLHFDEGNVVLEDRYDVEPVLNQSRIERDDTPSREFRKICNIPADVMDRAIREGWVHDQKAWKRWASDPDNAAFRVWGGRL